MEERKKLVKFLFDNYACLSCTPISYCGVFSDEETCLKCIDDAISKLLQHNVSNNEVAVCDLNADFQKYLREQGLTKCPQCGKNLIAN